MHLLEASTLKEAFPPKSRQKLALTALDLMSKVGNGPGTGCSLSMIDAMGRRITLKY